MDSELTNHYLKRMNQNKWNNVRVVNQMTLNLMFFTITIKKTKMTKDEAINEAIHRNYKEEKITKILPYQRLY